MTPLPPRSTRTDTLFPCTTLFRSDDVCGHLVLQLENVVDPTFKPFRPEVLAGGGVDKLPRDPYAALGFAQAALEDVAHPQLPPNLLLVDRPPLVGEARVPSDDEPPSPAGQGGYEVLPHPVDDIFLGGTAPEITERPD